MLDAKSKQILSILAKQCSGGGYKIVEVSDICSTLPRHMKMNEQNVEHILQTLERQDYISIKYDDDGVYCLCVLPYALDELQEEKFVKTKSGQNKTLFWNVFFCFLASLLGSVLGCLFFLIIK